MFIVSNKNNSFKTDKINKNHEIKCEDDVFEIVKEIILKDESKKEVNNVLLTDDNYEKVLKDNLSENDIKLYSTFDNDLLIELINIFHKLNLNKIHDKFVFIFAANIKKNSDENNLEEKLRKVCNKIKNFKH